MAKINLLPWRQEQRKEQQRQFLTVMGLMAILVAAGIFLVYLQYVRLIDQQNGRNTYLQQHINAVDKQIKEIDQLANKKQRLLDRMKIIEHLQSNRPAVVRMLDELVRVIPDGVYLTSFKQVKTNLKMTGYAQSNARVSAFMRNIEQSEWLTKPRLVVIEASTKHSNARKFTLLAQQKVKSEKKNKRGVQ